MQTVFLTLSGAFSSYSDWHSDYCVLINLANADLERLKRTKRTKKKRNRFLYVLKMMRYWTSWTFPKKRYLSSHSIIRLIKHIDSYLAVDKSNELSSLSSNRLLLSSYRLEYFQRPTERYTESHRSVPRWDRRGELVLRL